MRRAQIGYMVAEIPASRSLDCLSGCSPPIFGQGWRPLSMCPDPVQSQTAQRARTRTCQARHVKDWPGQFVRFTFSKRGQSVPPVLCQAQVALQQHAWGHDSSGGCGDLSTSLPIRALLKTQTHSRILPTVSFCSPSVMGVVAHTWGLLRSTGHGAEVHRRGCRPAARPREGCVVAEPRVRFH